MAKQKTASVDADNKKNADISVNHYLGPIITFVPSILAQLESFIKDLPFSLIS